jgi:hypothetical protein
MHGLQAALRCTNASGGTNDDVLTISWSTDLLNQALVCEPFLNQVGNLAVVFVHHHHVGITLDADLGQINHIVFCIGSRAFYTSFWRLIRKLTGGPRSRTTSFILLDWWTWHRPERAKHTAIARLWF